MGMKLGGGARRRDSGFQWLIIGIVLGMGCTFSFMLTLYVFEIIEVTIDEEAIAPPTEVVIVTAEPEVSTTAETAPVSENATESAVEMENTDTISTEAVDPSETNTNAPDANAAPTGLPGSEDTSTGTGAGTGVGTNSTPLPNSGTQPTATIGFSLDGNATTNTNPQDSNDTVGLNPPPESEGGQTSNTNLLSVASPMILIDGGIFRMGTTEDEALQAVAECVSRDSGLCTEDMVIDSYPAHEVYVDDFQMEQFEVNVQQFVSFLNILLEANPNATAPPHLTACNGPCNLVTTDPDGQNSDIAFDGSQYIVRPDAFDRSEFPITYVSWQGAQAYCEALGRRLPTEAEWERAARGADNSIYPWGFQWFNDDRANTSRSGNYGEGTWTVTTAPTGSQTEDGLSNMAGNVAEWTADYYNGSLYQQRVNSGQAPPENPAITTGSTLVVARGGAWDTVPLFARSVHRMDFVPNNFYPNVGFRCAATP